jgi:cation diffusion facilitator CzcD-associated flavoprotein CzcO
VSDLSDQTLSPGETVCIIGAGISGLTAAKACCDRGLPYHQFEAGSAVGGLWRYENDNGRAAAYRTLHINSSKHNMELADFPVPDDFPTFGHHSEVLKYIEDYADAFNLRDGITFNTSVDRVAPMADDRWAVTLDTGETRTYGAVLVATGHHWKPRRPDFPGSFQGREMHASDYRRPEDFTGERVLVVGIGNSACDIAVDLCRVAAHVTISTRSSAWILPKYILGIPLDQWTGYWMEYLPWWIRRELFRLLVGLTVGNQERYGVPKPEHDLMQEHPTISEELLAQVGHGRVDVRPNVERRDGRRVQFEDGTAAAFDALIHATGYEIQFPFVPDEVLSIEDNRVAFYRYVVPPAWPGLYFLGLIQPLGSVFPLVERQAKWVAALLDGELALPPPEEMRSTIEDTVNRMKKRYHDSPRHTIQVDFWDYVHRMEREWRAGKRRAQTPRGKRP